MKPSMSTNKKISQIALFAVLGIIAVYTVFPTVPMTEPLLTVAPADTFLLFICA